MELDLGHLVVQDTTPTAPLHATLLPAAAAAAQSRKKKKKNHQQPITAAPSAQALQQRNDILRAMATRATTHLYHALLALPRADSDESARMLAPSLTSRTDTVHANAAATSTHAGVMLLLPDPITQLPREKPLPKPKKPTKWEVFAKDKGIVKKSKKSKIVWDDAHQQWMPRFGKGRAFVKSQQDQTDWVMEHNDGDDPAVNPFAKRKQEKKERIAKNQKQQLANFKAAQGSRVAGTLDLEALSQTKQKRSKQKATARRLQKRRDQAATDTASSSTSAATNAGAGGDKKRRKVSGHVDVALSIAQRSSASMGVHDAPRYGEPAMKRGTAATTGKALLGSSKSLTKSNQHGSGQKNSKKKKAAPNHNLKSERDSSMVMLSRVLGRDGAGSSRGATSAAATGNDRSSGRGGKKRRRK